MARFAFFTLAQIVLDAPPSWWLAAYKFTLPASKRPRIDRLNAEMGAPPRRNAGAVAGMVSSHVGRPSTSQNTLPGTGLMGRCTGGPPRIETSLRRHEVCNARFAVLLVGL